MSTHSDCRWVYVWVQVRRDGAFGGSRMAVRDDSATTCDEDTTEVCRRSVHVQRIPGQQMPARMRRGFVVSLRQTRDRLKTTQCVAALDDMTGEEGSGDILGRPHSSIQTSLRRPHVNLGHQKNNVLIRPLARTRDATNLGGLPKLRMPCVRSCLILSCGTTIVSG